MFENNLSIYIQNRFTEKFNLEYGFGIGRKYIKTYFTASVNSPEKEIHPFTKSSDYYNGFAGLTLIPNEKSNYKINVSTGVRIPNLAELSSNGLHEGVFTYEIGSPLLKNEQNISANLLMNYDLDHFYFYINPFYTQFFNYVYLAPTSEDWFGFPVFRYKQQDAYQYGGEISLEYKKSDKWLIGISYSTIFSKTKDGNYTPFTPAQKITPSISYNIIKLEKNDLNAFVEGNLYMSQNNVAPSEKPTPSYWLLNLGVNESLKSERYSYVISVSVNNFFNKAYYDHMSRLKYFDLLNIGRNIVLTLRMSHRSFTKHNSVK